VECVGHCGNYLAASVFLNLLIISTSSAKLSTPIGTLVELPSQDSLPCLVNVALFLVFWEEKISKLSDFLLKTSKII